MVEHEARGESQRKEETECEFAKQYTFCTRPPAKISELVNRPLLLEGSNQFMRTGRQLGILGPLGSLLTCTGNGGL